MISGNVFSVNDYRLGRPISMLTDKQGDIILLYYFAGYSIKNIADMYGTSHQNISYAHITALKKLREILEATIRNKYSLLNFDTIDKKPLPPIQRLCRKWFHIMADISDILQMTIMFFRKKSKQL